MKSSFPIIQSVIENGSLGRMIPINDNECLIIHNSGFGQWLSSDDSEQCSNLEVIGEYAPQYFHLYEVQPKMVEIILQSNPSWNLFLRKRMKGSHNGLDVDVVIPSEFTLIDARELLESQFDKIPQSLYQKFYSNFTLFKEKSRAKVLLNKQNEFCSICYAAAWGDDIAEIDVYTETQYRGLGLGEKVVGSFVNDLKAHSLRANWDCFIDNKGSIALAKKCGFNLNDKYWMLSIFQVDEWV